MDPIRVFIADDHTVLRAGLRALLDAQTDMEVVGEAADGESALAQFEDLRPHVVLMDISMEGMGGLEATKQVKSRYPEIKVLVLTMHEDGHYLRQFLKAGASGYVIKRAADNELTAAIRAVHAGENYVHPSLATALVDDFLAPGPARADAASEADGLTEREREVLQLVALGYTNQQTADRLFVSVKTIETHRAHLMAKLGLRSRAELVRYAMKHDLLQE